MMVTAMVYHNGCARGRVLSIGSVLEEKNGVVVPACIAGEPLMDILLVETIGCH